MEHPEDEFNGLNTPAQYLFVFITYPNELFLLSCKVGEHEETDSDCEPVSHAHEHTHILTYLRTLPYIYTHIWTHKNIQPT